MRPRAYKRDAAATRASESELRSANAVPPGLAVAPAGTELLAPLLLGISAGLQLTLAALVLLGPRRAIDPATLTELGRRFCHPEWDIPIYAGGCVVSLALALVVAAIYRRTAARRAATLGPEEYRAWRTYALGVLSALAVIGVALFLILLLGRFPLPKNTTTPLTGGQAVRLPTPTALDVAALLALAPAMLACAALELRRVRVHLPERRATATAPTAIRLGWMLDAACAVVLVAIVFIPRAWWGNVMSSVMNEEGMYHWNFFVMDPALSWHCGLALGTARDWQYGAGWPLVMGCLAWITPLAYRTMLGIGVIWGCAYYVGVYALLRQVAQRRTLALVGALAAILLQMFNGIKPALVMWYAPSSTCLRHPLDVFAAIALLQFARSGRRGWALAGGALVGLELLFSPDNGLYLVLGLGLVIALYLLKARQPGLRGALRPITQTGGAATAVAAAVLLAGLLVASRGTLFSRAFWTGYLEALIVYPKLGLGQLPLAGVEDGAVLLFALFCATYLLALGWAVTRALRPEPLAAQDALLAGLAGYGLLQALLFVGRSHPYNIYHVAVPFVLVVVVGAARLASRGPVRRSVLPVAALAVVALWLLSNPQFAVYPALLRVGLTDPPRLGSYLFPDTADVPVAPEWEHTAAAFRADAADLRHITAGGARAAVLTEQLDTPMYLATGLRPWGRYVALATSSFTLERVQSEVQRLEADRPQYVVLEVPRPHNPNPYREAVAGRYELLKVGAATEIWRLRESPAASAPAGH